MFICCDLFDIEITGNDTLGFEILEIIAHNIGPLMLQPNVVGNCAISDLVRTILAVGDI